MIKPYKISELVNNSYFKILFFSTIIVCTKWFISATYYDENINFKVFLDSEYDDYYYYPFIKYLSELNFNLSFDQEINNLKIIAIPFYTTIIHTLFFKLFGSWSILLLQILFFSFVIYFFYYYLIQIGINKNLAIILSFLLFLLPRLLETQSLIDYIYLNNLSLYNLRFPNALVTKFFLYFYIYLIIQLNLKYKNLSEFKTKDIITLSILFCFLLGSYYYFFMISALSFLIFLIYKNNFSFLFKFVEFKKLFLLTLIFIIFALPIFITNIYVEPDFLERLGVFQIDNEKKIKILQYIFLKFSKIEFILILTLIFILAWIINVKKLEGYKIIIIFNIMLIASLAAPIVFFLISPVTLHISSFFAMIINLIFLNIFLQIIVFLKKFLNSIVLKFNSTKFLFLIFCAIFFNYNYLINFYQSKINDEKYSVYRNELYLITEEINDYKKKNPDLKILTFDRNLQVWSIMNNIKYIVPLSGQVVSKTHNQIENDLIDTFNFFKLNEENFVNFLAVQKMNFRYTNAELQNYFWGRYTANSLKTYNDSNDFDQQVLKDIKNTPLIYHQNLAVPNFEMNRLREKFQNRSLNENFSPDLIVINNSFARTITKPNGYCLQDKFQEFYYLVKTSNICK